MLDASELSRRLAHHAEAVCRNYLSNGRRDGRYWLIGDVANTPGRSLYVRLQGPETGRGAAGRWRDAATGERGDLLDLIAAVENHRSLAQTLDEARRFLSLPAVVMTAPDAPSPRGSPLAARRLFAMSKPVAGTVAERYLRGRGITAPLPSRALRFHPQCWYRPRDGEPATRLAWPALIAAVTDFSGQITGVQRTWLAPRGGKAPVASPRRAMGALLGHGVRFGAARDTLLAGEGLETVLSVRSAIPTLPAVAALSAAHLTALELPAGLRRLYIAQDADRAGRRATTALAMRASGTGTAVTVLTPTLDDFNTDLMAFGLDAVRARLRIQLTPEDLARLEGLTAPP